MDSMEQKKPKDTKLEISYAVCNGFVWKLSFDVIRSVSNTGLVCMFSALLGLFSQPEPQLNSP